MSKDNKKEVIRIKDAKHWKKLRRSKKWQDFPEEIPESNFPLYAIAENSTVLLNIDSILAYADAAMANGDIRIDWEYK